MSGSTLLGSINGYFVTGPVTQRSTLSAHQWPSREIGVNFQSMLVSWLIDWLIGWLVDCLYFASFIYRLIDWLVTWLIDSVRISTFSRLYGSYWSLWGDAGKFSTRLWLWLWTKPRSRPLAPPLPAIGVTQWLFEKYPAPTSWHQKQRQYEWEKWMLSREWSGKNDEDDDGNPSRSNELMLPLLSGCSSTRRVMLPPADGLKSTLKKTTDCGSVVSDVDISS